MAYKLMLADERKWTKDCGAIQHERLRKILVMIRKLENDPWAGNIHVQQLKNYALADFRLCVSEYRVLFNKDEESKTIYLLRVLHRSKLY